MRRRDLLAGLGGAALAGCLSRSGGSTPTPTPSESGPHPVTPTMTALDVRSRQCGEGRNEATIAFDGDDVSVDGVIAGRDSCDTARLAQVRLQDDVLTVVIEVGQARPTQTAACAQCLTDIAYTFVATVPAGGPARVRVVHRTADGRATVATADRA